MRKLLALSSFFVLLLVTSADAAFNQTWCTHPLGYQQLTSLGSAAGFTSVPQGTIYVGITVEAAPIRWRDDGVPPTSSVGMPVAAGASFSYTMNFATIKFIQQTSGAIVNVYFCGP